MQVCSDPPTSRERHLDNNVLTRFAGARPIKGVEKQEFKGCSLRRALEISPYCVRDEDVEPRSASKPKKARRKRKTLGKRGPKGSTYLEWNQVKQVIALAHQARTAGVPLNVLVTIRAPKDLSDAKGKRIISRRIAHLGQALKRRGQDHIGVTVYEKRPHLHAHHLVHVTPRNMTFIQGWSEGNDGDVDVREADRSAPFYITKQRRWMGPEIEVRIAKRQGRRWWEESAYVAGPRLSFTTATKALMAYRTVLKVSLPAEGPTIPTTSLEPEVSAADCQPQAERQCRHSWISKPLVRAMGGHA